MLLEPTVEFVLPPLADVLGFVGVDDFLDRPEEGLELGAVFHRCGGEPVGRFAASGTFVEKVDRGEEQDAIGRAGTAAFVDFIGQNAEQRPDARLEIELVAFPGIQRSRGLVHNRREPYPDARTMAADSCGILT